MSLGGDTGAQLLVKLGLVEQAIEYAMEAGAFEHAFDLCCVSLKHKLPEVQCPRRIFFLALKPSHVNRVIERLAALCLESMPPVCTNMCPGLTA